MTLVRTLGPRGSRNPFFALATFGPGNSGLARNASRSRPYGKMLGPAPVVVELRGSSMQFINTHDLPGLQQEFAALPVPQRALLVRTLRGGLKIVKLAPLVGKWVDLDRVDRALGGVAKAKAVERAAYEWLKPESTRTRDTLADLQSEVGLQKLKPGAFADELRHACESFRKAAPRLTRHIDK